jgi:hypothetical protein
VKKKKKKKKKIMCACETGAQLLRSRCPVCRGPIQLITQVFT